MPRPFVRSHSENPLCPRRLDSVRFLWSPAGPAREGSCLRRCHTWQPLPTRTWAVMMAGHDSG